MFSEVFYDPKGRREGDKEWIELYNPTLIDIHLNGWKIIDNNGDGSSFEFPKGTTITSKEHLIVARNNKGFKKLYRFNPDIDGLSL